MKPYTVNACYNSTANDITFPAAILQPPLYDVNASREENLGGIGYIIAHEITHAFDNNGAKFDENGSAADWWTSEDYAAFQQKCQAVADVHGPDKLRCNRVLQTLPEFYETYGIQPGDGMWTGPASRVSVW